MTLFVDQAIITRIFGECCKFLMGLNEKDLTIPNYDGLPQLGTFPELHENSVKQINLLLCIRDRIFRYFIILKTCHQNSPLDSPDDFLKSKKNQI